VWKKGWKKGEEGWEKGEEGWEKGEEGWEKGEDYPLSSPSYIEEEQTTQRKSTNGQTTYLCVRDIDFATLHHFSDFGTISTVWLLIALSIVFTTN
jgi:hypothetical protein